MEYQQRANPLFAACGLNCGLCPRHHTAGTSRCPGCAGENFSQKHPSCGHLSCVVRHGIEYCFQCEEYPCPRFKKAVLTDSFITHQNMMRNFQRVIDEGLEPYEEELAQKVQLLKILLEQYDDGRRKSFYCMAVDLLPLKDLTFILEQLAKEIDSDTSQKERAALAVSLMEKAAQERNVILKLRKKGEG